MSRARDFRSLSIVPGCRACPAARALANQRFPAHGAPPLPLPVCRNDACHCHYREHSDRRHGRRRAGDRNAPPVEFAGADQRAADRRRHNHA
jgi:hypothetical protein